MTKQQEYASLLIGILRNYCPKDTYQLVNSIKMSNRGKNIVVSIGEGVVSSNGYNYTRRTNDKWSDGLNPNQQWVQKAIKQANMIFASKYGGNVYA